MIQDNYIGDAIYPFYGVIDYNGYEIRIQGNPINPEGLIVSPYDLEIICDQVGCRK